MIDGFKIKQFDGKKNKKTDKVIAICDVCGYKNTFRISSILNGKYSCKACAARNHWDGKRVTVETVKERMGRLFPTIKVDYTTYGGLMRNMDCECVECGHKFKRRPNTFFNMKAIRYSPCPKCTKEMVSREKTKTTEEFVMQANNRYGEGKYEILGNYESSNRKIRIRCLDCGKSFDIEANSFLQGHGCPYHNCNSSKIEKEVADFRPEAILLYSCSVRKSFWENYVNIEMIPFQKIAETSGFHTWGEVKRDPRTGNVWEYNITLLSIAMREGDRPEGDLGEIVVDDSVLKGQASLIKRLSQLVSATTSELQNAYDDLEKVNEQLRILSNHDALTGLYNRRRLDEFANDVIDTAEQTGADVTMLMLDIDYFKNVNDTYGHDVGDGVLVEIAHLLDEHVSSHAGAAVGRWGGEEFLAVIPNMESDQAFDFSEEIRKAVEAHKHKDIPERITISIGCLCFRGKVFDRTKLFKDVDDCLYEAKRRGRNRVIQTKL